MSLYLYAAVYEQECPDGNKNGNLCSLLHFATEVIIQFSVLSRTKNIKSTRLGPFSTASLEKAGKFFREFRVFRSGFNLRIQVQTPV